MNTVTSDYYEIDGEHYPRVTRILDALAKPGLATWRGRVGNYEADKVSKTGRDIGTAFHDVAAQINRGEHLKRGWQPPGELRHMASKYIEWLHTYIEKIISNESTTFSEVYKYAGTPDLVAIFKGDTIPSVIDIKTSNSPSEDWPLQLSAYKLALEEHNQPIARRVIVRVSKKDDNVLEMFEYTDHAIDEAVWLHIREIWPWTQDTKRRQKNSLVKGSLSSLII